MARKAQAKKTTTKQSKIAARTVPLIVMKVSLTFFVCYVCDSQYLLSMPLFLFVITVNEMLHDRIHFWMRILIMDKRVKEIVSQP